MTKVARGAVTTVTFEEKGGKTLLVMHELYPSKEALDAAGLRGTRDARDVRAAGRASRHPGIQFFRRSVSSLRRCESRCAGHDVRA
jgi:hypothetical protein